MRMLDTLKKNWPFVLISTLALAVMGTCFFFPPAFVAFLGFALASSPAFVALGTAASTVASATVAFTMGAAMLLVGDIARRFFSTTFNFARLAIAGFESSQAPVKGVAGEENTTEELVVAPMPVTAPLPEDTIVASEENEKRAQDNQFDSPVASTVIPVSRPVPTKQSWTSSLSNMITSSKKPVLSLLAVRRPQPTLAAAPEADNPASVVVEKMPIVNSTNQTASPVASPARAATPVASPLRAATPVASPARAATPVASPARAATPVASPVRAATPVASPARAATPVASPARAATPVASPVRAATPVASPLRAATPVASPARAATPVASPARAATPVASPARAATPVASPARATTPVASALRAASPVQQQSETNNKSLEDIRFNSSSASVDDNSTSRPASRRSHESATRSPHSPTFFDAAEPTTTTPRTPNQVTTPVAPSLTV